VPINQNVQVDLAHYAPIASWDPKPGDFVVWHGFITHWFGVVSVIQPNGSLSITKAGLPLFLFTMDPEKIEKSMVRMHVSKIKSSHGGEWAALQVVGNQAIWYV